MSAVIETTAETIEDESSVTEAVEPSQESLTSSQLPAVPGTEFEARVPVGAAPRSVVPAADEIRSLASLAVAIAGAHVGVSKELWDKPNDVLAVFLAARDLGMALTTALREFHIIEGKVTLSPKVKLAAVREVGKSQGWHIWPDPGNNRERAVWYAKRPEYGDSTFVSEFTWQDAQEAELVSWKCSPGNHTEVCKAPFEYKNGQKQRKSEAVCKENWRKYPARMLSWRSCGYLLDDQFGEIGTGLYSPDELGAITDEEGVPVIDVSSVEAPAGMGKRAAAGGGGQDKPDAPGVAMASEELRAGLRRRIDALPAAAQDFLAEWWKKPKDNGDHRSPLKSMTVADSIAVQSMVTRLERRVAAGEWGEPVVRAVDGLPDDPEFDVDPDGSETGQEKPLEAPVTAETGPAAVSVPEPVAEDPGGPVAAEFKAQVAAMDNATVAEYLSTMGLSTKGSFLAQRARLEVALIQEAVEAKWAEEAAAQVARDTDG